MSLEAIANVGRGAMVGFGTAIDPVGYLVNRFDMDNTGVGLGSRRSIPTAFSAITKSAYDQGTEDLTAGGYLARGAGFLGAGYVGVSAIGALTAAVPLFGIVPVGLAVYGAARGIGRYLHDIVVGENERFEYGGNVEEFRTKSSVGNGVSYGFNSVTDFLSTMVHAGESILTGRDYSESHLESSVKRSAGAMRRNLRAGIGSFVGAVGGGALLYGGAVAGAAVGSVAGPIGTLIGGLAGFFGIPLYRIARATGRTSRGERVKRKYPAHVKYKGGNVRPMRRRRTRVVKGSAMDGVRRAA